MRKILFASVLLGTAVAQAGIAPLINEFQPNPVSTDPADVSIELIGAPLSGFSGFLSTIDMDGAVGTLDRQTAVSGSFDANGLAVVTVPDLENPGFTLIFSTGDAGGVLGTDLDIGNVGVLDDPSLFGTVFDAISIPDDPTDAGYYAGQLGGQDFVYSGDEPKLAFRDGVTGDWYAVNDVFGNPVQDVYDINGTQVPNASFNLDPELTTFGATNPTIIPEPASLMLLTLGAFALRRRS